MKDKKVIKKQKRTDYTKEEKERFKEIKVEQKEFDNYFNFDSQNGRSKEVKKK